MTTLNTFPKIVSTGKEVNPDTIDWLLDSSEAIDDIPELHRRMNEHGYLYMRGLLNRDWVMDARRSICEKIADMLLDPDAPLIDAVWNRKTLGAFKPEFATGNPVIERLLYTGEMIEFYNRFFGKPAAHYDFTWLRSVAPGPGTSSHCDVVYMGRGERQQLFTTWTPLGDIDFAQGGLMVLDGSNNFDPLKRTYGEHDVDTFCTNKGDGKSDGDGWKSGFNWLPGTNMKAVGGALGNDPNAVRDAVGGTWRTTEFSAGDVLIFTCYTVHASMDNTSDRIRLSTDSRYQPMGTVLDERWVGSNPIAHSQAGKRGKIC